MTRVILLALTLIAVGCIGGDDSPFLEFPECPDSPGISTNEAGEITSGSATLTAEITRPSCPATLMPGFYLSPDEDLYGDNLITIPVNEIEELDENRFTITTSQDQLQPNTTYFFTTYVTLPSGTYVDDPPRQFTTLSD